MASSSSILLSKAEKSYITAGVLSNPPSRADGRSLQAFRTISLETGTAPLANGSARLSIGRNPHDGSGGTEILAATKLEVDSIGPGNEGVEGGRIACSVTCSPSAYPFIPSSGALDDLQYDYTTILQTTLTHPSLHPSNLSILAGKKSWLLNLDLIVLSDAGNVYDAMFMAARAALWDTKVPRTRSVEYRAGDKGGATAAGKAGAGSLLGGAVKSSSGTENTSGDMDVDTEPASSFDTRQQIQTATDFELSDYWDEGEVLDGRDRWPVCITLNLVPPCHFLDASLQEEAATPSRILLMFSLPSSHSPATSRAEISVKLQGMRTLGSSELTSVQIAEVIKSGQGYALEVWKALEDKLKDEAAGKAKERKKF